MPILRTISLAAILLTASVGTTFAQGMVDMLRQEQAQIEQQIQELEQLGSAVDEFQKLKLQELKLKHAGNEKMINTLTQK